MSASIKGNFAVVKCDSESILKGIKEFDCGDQTLNKFLQQVKRQCKHDNIHALLLLDNDKVIGFVTASLHQLTQKVVPDDMFPYAVPPFFAVMKIPMIAIDKKYQRQKQKWGTQLLRAILDYSIESADQVKGIKGVFLDAKVEARSFYESFDFKAISEDVSPNNTIPMFISMDMLRASKVFEKSA